MDKDFIAKMQAESRATEYLEGARWHPITEPVEGSVSRWYWIYDGTGVYDVFYWQGVFSTEEGHEITATHWAPYCVPKPPGGEA